MNLLDRIHFDCAFLTFRRIMAAPRPAGCGVAGLVLAASLLTGCVAPIGADRVTSRQSYAQVAANGLRSGEASAATVSILHRYGLERLADRQPDEAVRRLHDKALDTGERDLLFALSEMSYLAAAEIKRSVKPWDPRQARDYYLGSAIYAWLFLFGEGEQPPPGPFDHRFRAACDFYNYGLGLGLVEGRNTNAIVCLTNERRPLPVGAIELQLDVSRFPTPFEEFDKILLADRYRVRGLSVRNRQTGIGTPLICAQPLNPELNISPSIPATVLLRAPTRLADLTQTTPSCALELYPILDEATVTVGAASVPLEMDLTTYRAYTLNQSRIWKLGRLAFLAPAEQVRNQLLMNQPYDPKRIPVVFVHGTFSSPVTWAEMVNTLITDPALRQRYQIWSFIYGSGNPLIYSVADLRSALTEKVQQLDPQGTNTMLRQMVVIGHSQGGLLTKATAVDTGDKLWHLVNTNRLEDVDMTELQRAEIKRLLFYTPLPFVKRVVFIATPHRGSYLSGNLARRWGRRLVSLPGTIVARSTDMFKQMEGSEVGKFLRNRMPTSLDGMSPKNPGLLALADIPVAPEIKAHSIIPVKGDGEPHEDGRDGVVSYASAHLDHVESEFIVRYGHSCLNEPATIEEVRRILHLHLSNQ